MGLLGNDKDLDYEASLRAQDTELVIKGEKDPLTAAWENAGVLAGLLAVFAPAVLLAPIYAFGPLFTKALALSWTTAAAVGGVGAFAGLLIQLYSNSIRKLPLMRRE